MKIIKKVLFLMILNIITINFVITCHHMNIRMNSKAFLYLVTDQKSYQKGEIINLNFNLDHFANLTEVSIQLKIDQSKLKPLLENDQYFNFSSSSIFNKSVVNDFVDEKYLRLRLIKDQNITEGYFPSYKNNLCNLVLQVEESFNSLDEVIYQDDLVVHLYDNHNQLISYELSYEEKMQVRWDIASYELEVFSEVPSFKDDITILNRIDTEYEYLVEKTINTATTGLKTVHIGLYDKKTADYIVLSKAVNIVDHTPPTISKINNIVIKDQDILKMNYLEEVMVSDNYDQDLNLFITYYDDKYLEIPSLEDFNNYLMTNLQGYLKYQASDQSNNIATTDFVMVNVIDTTPPTISEVSNIEIYDYEIKNFHLLDYIKISDNYDQNPKLIFDFKENSQLSEEELLAKIAKGYIINFSYFGLDNANNKTKVIETKIEVIDTTAPIISVDDLIINDVDYEKTINSYQVVVSDNFIYECEIVKTYYLNDKLVAKGDFDKGILKGQSGYISYYAVDKYQNQSIEVIQNIKIIDTTCPIIKVYNIENNQKYVHLEDLNYEIIDNFEGVSFNVLLDGNPYLKENLTIGSHHLEIVANDLSGNKTTLSLDFEIIEDNIIGCGGDYKCYVNNYLEVVIIVCALLIFIMVMIIAKIIIKSSHRHLKPKN